MKKKHSAFLIRPRLIKKYTKVCWGEFFWWFQIFFPETLIRLEQYISYTWVLSLKCNGCSKVQQDNKNVGRFEEFVKSKLNFQVFSTDKISEFNCIKLSSYQKKNTNGKFRDVFRRLTNKKQNISPRKKKSLNNNRVHSMPSISANSPILCDLLNLNQKKPNLVLVISATVVWLFPFPTQIVFLSNARKAVKSGKKKFVYVEFSDEWKTFSYNHNLEWNVP